ncbi:MAG: hypothetical protein EU539_12220, partial [Promethearchaeota archaeon]
MLMKNKKFFLIIMMLFLLNLILISDVVAADYNIELTEDKNLIWKVEKFDEDVYEDIFPLDEADFDEDDQKKIHVNSIDERSSKWVISYDQWDYTDDTNDFNDSPDDDKTKSV